MAVAVHSTAETKNPLPPMGLVTASVAGAVLVLFAAAVVLLFIPSGWDAGVHKTLSDATNSFVSTAIMIAAQVGAAIAFLWLGSKLLAGKQATGVRGGIFFVLAVAFVGFFCVKAIYLRAGQGFNFGNLIVMLFFGVILLLLVQFFRTGRFTEWSTLVDRGGWFDTHSYKRTQGHRVRRLTILGILLLAGSGIWTLMHHNYLPQNADVKLPSGETVSNRLGDWVVGGTLLVADAKNFSGEENRARPRVQGGVTLLPDLQFTIPLVLIGACLWFAWRVVNYPTFADFLIATEAEINKVSWTSRKALFRDTIVVLTSLVLITFFLFVVDVFWSWLLSREVINVLPSESERPKMEKSGEPVTDW
jgi:preprotein translocase SecE subunit